MAAVGRPIEWTEERKKEACETIFNRIEEGESVRTILKPGERGDDLPSMRVFQEWLSANKELSNQYVRSIEIRAELMADEILKIADNVGGDAVVNEDGKVVIDFAVVNRDRLRVDSRKWLLSKMYPKKYGEKIDMTTKGESLNDLSSVSTAELQARAAAIAKIQSVPEDTE